MSGTATITANLSVVLANGVNVSLGGSQIAIAVAGNNISQGTATLSTSESAIPLGSIATNGLALLKNLDPAIAIYYGITSGENLTLGPGEVALVRWKSGQTPYWKAASGTPTGQFLLVEN